MSDHTKIEWADATLNPAYGCSKVSPGCANCYALRDAKRFAQNPAVADKFAGLIDPLTGEWTGRVNLFPKRMEQALRWRKPRRIFVGSMVDLFHEEVPFGFVDELLATMTLCARHTFMILTKRPERMRECLTYRTPEEWREYMSGLAMCLHGEEAGCQSANAINGCLAEGHNVGWPMRNVILMTTVEDQPRADERLPHLVSLAAHGWRTGVSIEPMLGPVDLWIYLQSAIHEDEVGLEARRGPIREVNGEAFRDPWVPGLDWVICGGESGPGARPMHPDWVRSLRNQCQEASVPFFFKQWGNMVWKPVPLDIPKERSVYCYVRKAFIGSGDPHGSKYNPDGYYAAKYSRAGRLLDGREHNDIPEVRS